MWLRLPFNLSSFLFECSPVAIWRFIEWQFLDTERINARPDCLAQYRGFGPDFARCCSLDLERPSKLVLREPTPEQDSRGRRLEYHGQVGWRGRKDASSKQALRER